MARRPNRAPNGSGDGTPDSGSLLPDFTPGGGGSPPCDPPEFTRVCMPPGSEEGWDPANWIMSLSIDWSGVSFDGCADPGGCSTAIGASYWDILKTAEGFAFASTEANLNFCELSAPPIDIGSAFDWDPRIQFTRFNGPNVDNIKIELFTNNVAPPGELFITFNLSDDRLSTSDYFDWPDNTASPPFSAFPLTWTQTVKCQNNQCPTGAAVFTLSLVPNCPEPPVNDNPTGLPESDPCKDGSSIRLDCFPVDPGDGTPTGPEVPDPGCWHHGRRFVSAGYDGYPSCDGPARGSIGTYFRANEAVEFEPRVAAPYVVPDNGENINLFYVRKGAVGQSTYQLPPNFERAGNPYSWPQGPAWAPLVHRVFTDQDFTLWTDSDGGEIVYPGASFRQEGFPGWDLPNLQREYVYDAGLGGGFHDGSCLVIPQRWGREISSSFTSPQSACVPGGFYTGPLCQTCFDDGQPSQVCPAWRGRIHANLYIACLNTDVWDVTFDGLEPTIPVQTCSTGALICNADGYASGAPTTSLNGATTQSRFINVTGPIADVMVEFYWSFNLESLWEGLPSDFPTCAQQETCGWPTSFNWTTFERWIFRGAFDWTTHRHAAGSPLGSPENEFFDGTKFNKSFADNVYVSTPWAGAGQPRLNPDASWSLRHGPGLTNVDDLQITCVPFGADSCRWSTAPAAAPLTLITGGPPAPGAIYQHFYSR